MKVLVIGSGGREHALIWKISQSKLVKEIYCAPGNGGICEIATCIPIKATDVEGIVKFSLENKIDLVVVAPDDPLMLGMVDALQDANIRAFGPSKNAAIIEGSKLFAKKLMKKYNIPTASYDEFSDSQSAISYIDTLAKYPIVIKADGLALGKGVTIAANYEDAKDTIINILDHKIFGSAGDKIIIEEYLEGQEVSILAFTDGNTILPMESVQDHKKVYDNDMGPNTGGMGTFSPSRFYDDELSNICMDTIFIPTINAMNSEGIKFKGILYFGLIITNDGPKVLEYNARFGDPETQALLPRLKNDIIEIFNACIDEKLKGIILEWSKSVSACVVMASSGYPKEYQIGYEITGLDSIKCIDNTIIFHSGTRKENNRFYTAGGRVLGVTSLDSTLQAAAARCYDSINIIDFQGKHFRRDIANKKIHK